MTINLTAALRKPITKETLREIDPNDWQKKAASCVEEKGSIKYF